MGVHSGKHGVIHVANPSGGAAAAETFVRNWTTTDTETPEVYYASNTLGGPYVNAGVNDWSGSFDGFGKHPSILPGNIFDFQGYTAPGNDIYGQQGKIQSGKAICDAVSITWNFSPGGSLEWSASFSAAEAGLTESDGFIDDVNADIPEKMCGLKIEEGASGSEAEWLNVTTATLTLTSDNQAFVNSSTGCFTHRLPGNVNFSLAITEQEEAFLRAKSSNYRLKLYVDATTFWLLEWAHLQEYSGLTVSRESGAIIEKTANLIMSGSDGSANGQVVLPDASVWWPVPVNTTTVLVAAVNDSPFDE